MDPTAETLPPAVPIAAAALPPAPAAPPADVMAAERARCAAIQAATLPGFNKLSVQAIEDGWPAAQFIRAQSNAGEAVEAARKEAAGQGFRGSFVEPVPAGGTGGQVDPAKLPPAERAKAEWDAKPEIRAEFASVETYAAYLQAEADGKVRVLSRKV